jgi:hypothetical protein
MFRLEAGRGRRPWPSQFALLRGWVASNSEAEAPKLNNWLKKICPSARKTLPVQVGVLANRFGVDVLLDGFASEARRKASIGAPFNAGASVPKADDLAHYSAKH